MLCLFLGGCAFFWFLVLGNGKPFKNKGLQVFQGWCGYISQNLKKGGGGVSKCLKDAADNQGTSAPGHQGKKQKGEREIGNYYYIYIFIFIYTHYLTYAIFYACLLYILSSCAYLYACFFRSFYIVIYSKTQHMQQKRHSKKPLQFCNNQKASKINDLRKLCRAFF